MAVRQEASEEAAETADPKVRPDGRCARTGCSNLRPGDNLQSQVPGLTALLADDPFCSAACCRLHHGIE